MYTTMIMIILYRITSIPIMIIKFLNSNLLEPHLRLIIVNTYRPGNKKEWTRKVLGIAERVSRKLQGGRVSMIGDLNARDEVTTLD